MRNFQSLLLVLLFHTAAIHARKWSSKDLPSPQKDSDSICGRGTLSSSVCDPDGFISQSDADTIDGLANFINEGSHGFKQVQCKGTLKGAQVAVAVVESMIRGTGSKEDRAFQFAKDLHDRWGVGDADCQNGVVLFLAIKDRAIGISIGAGIKSIFTNAMVPKVISIMKSKLRKKQYGQGIVDGIVTIGNILSTGKAPEVHEERDSSGAWILAIFAGVAGITVIGSTRKRNRYARCKKLLENIDNDRGAAQRREYVAKSCPICLEDFEETRPPQQNSTTQQLHEMENGAARISEAGAGRTITASRTTSRPDDVLVRVLPCGHKFHETCIISWLSGAGSSNQLCPICRQPVTGDGAGPGSQMPSNVQAGGWEMYDSEYSFRLRRARYFYPDFITWNMINSWERDRYNDSSSLADSSVFKAVDPAVVAAAARSSGSGGTSFSFGGAPITTTTPAPIIPTTPACISTAVHSSVYPAAPPEAGCVEARVPSAVLHLPRRVVGTLSECLRVPVSGLSVRHGYPWKASP